MKPDDESGLMGELMDGGPSSDSCPFGNRAFDHRPLPYGADEARFADAGGDTLAEEGDVLGGDVARERKAQRTAGALRGNPHGSEYARRFG